MRARIKSPELTALMIAPDRNLAEQFTSSLGAAKAFQILSDLKAYPSNHALDIRLRQLRPDVVLIDLISNREAAFALIEFITRGQMNIQTVGLSFENDPDTVLGSLRVGAIEFLHAPFDEASQRQAVLRLSRLREPDPASAAPPGTVMAFTGAKPGSGSSTLAIQTAIALRRISGKRVLLADLDIAGGTLGFSAGLGGKPLVVNAWVGSEHWSLPMWSTLVSDVYGLDVLTAPEVPLTSRLDDNRLRALLEFARINYDFALIDLPVVFHRSSLVAISNADRAMIVATSELASLHFARKAVTLLNQLGFPRDRFRVLLNRVSRKENLSKSSLEKLLDCVVLSEFPNEFSSMQRVIGLGRPVDDNCEFGKAIDAFASRLAGLQSGPER